MLKFEIVECRQLLGGVVIVEILAAVVAQQVIGRHSWVFSEIFLWRIAARRVSNKGKVPKGSCAKSFVTSDDETRPIHDVKKK